ncbi:MAG: hypothetical protein R2770_12455 [Acidimicrobiales bacterium]
MSLFHPSRSRLEKWFTHDELDEDLERHVESCMRCSDEIERIAEDQIDVGSALAAVLEPEPGLERRMETRIEAAMLAKRDLKLLLEVLGSGFRTAKILIDPPDPESRR